MGPLSSCETTDAALTRQVCSMLLAPAPVLLNSSFSFPRQHLAAPRVVVSTRSTHQATLHKPTVKRQQHPLCAPFCRPPATSQQRIQGADPPKASAQQP